MNKCDFYTATIDCTDGGLLSAEWQIIYMSGVVFKTTVITLQLSCTLVKD